MDAFQVNIINARVRLQTVYVALSFFTQTYPCFLLLYAVYRPAIHIKSNELFFCMFRNWTPFSSRGKLQKSGHGALLCWVGAVME